jgi:membrane fusion protein (multidrug efflux system)
LVPGFAACGRAQAKKDTPSTGIARREAVRVRVEPVRLREMVRRLETTARVESERQVAILPRTAGVVVELLAEEGDRVEAGAVLARLDDRDAQLALQDARGAVASAKADQPKLELAIREVRSLLDSARLAYEQAERDHERNLRIAEGAQDQPSLISKKDLDASQLARDQRQVELQNAMLALEKAQLEAQAGQAALERALVSLERSELTLSYLAISAPLGGVIAERSIKIGDSLSSSSPAFVLTDPTDLRVVFHRPQRELGFFQSAVAHGAPAGGDGDPADVLPSNGHGPETAGALRIQARAEALPDLSFEGTIERLSPTIDPASGNFRITASMSPEGRNRDGKRAGRLLPGMLLRLEIVTERRPQALSVPKRAVRREGDMRSVFLVIEGIARRVEVEEGLSDDEHVEVRAVAPGQTAGLVDGAQVVVVGNRDLEDGTPVQVEGSSAAPANQADAAAKMPASAAQPASGGSASGD